VYSTEATTINDLDNYNKKLYLYNIARINEFELSQTEWYDFAHYSDEDQLIHMDHF
jgi:hypothetical protein